MTCSFHDAHGPRTNYPLTQQICVTPLQYSNQFRIGTENTLVLSGLARRQARRHTCMQLASIRLANRMDVDRGIFRDTVSLERTCVASRSVRIFDPLAISFLWPFPRSSGQHCNHTQYRFHSPVLVPGVPRCQQGCDVRGKLCGLPLLGKIALKQRASNVLPLVLHVGREGFDDASRIDGSRVECRRQVEQVTPFFPLVECS